MTLVHAQVECHRLYHGPGLCCPNMRMQTSSGAALLLASCGGVETMEPLRGDDFVGEVCGVLRPVEQCQGRRRCHYDGDVVLDLDERRSVAAYVEH
eukprot:2963221-Rhodomonas_salina.1